MTPVERCTDGVSLLLSPHTFPQAKNNSVPPLRVCLRVYLARAFVGVAGAITLFVTHEGPGAEL